MNENTRLLVVVNRTAARARREWPRIRDALEQNLLRFDAHETERAGDGTVAVRKALRAGYNLIAVVGGDGTLSEAAEGFFDLPEAKHQEHALHHAASHPSASRASAFEPVPINEDAALALL